MTDAEKIEGLERELSEARSHLGEVLKQFHSDSHPMLRKMVFDSARKWLMEDRSIDAAIASSEAEG